MARDNLGAAERWVARLIERGQGVADAPLAGRVVPEFGRAELREAIERSYRIVYRVEAGDVRILTVFEGRRLLRPSDVEDD